MQTTSSSPLINHAPRRVRRQKEKAELKVVGIELAEVVVPSTIHHANVQT